MVEINYKDSIRDYEIDRSIKNLKLIIGATCVDEITSEQLNEYEWISDNTLLINFNFTYSNGTIIMNECKYFDVIFKITQYDYYEVTSTVCKIIYEDY